MTPRKPEHEKKAPGRRPLAAEDRRSPAGYVRLRAADLERLDAVAGQGSSRQAFMTAAVLKAIAAAERKRAKS